MKMSSSSAIDEHNNSNEKNEKKRKKKKNKGTVVEKEQKEEELLDEDEDKEEEEYKCRCDVLKRRSKRLKQLSNIYRDYYWCLIEQLKLKHTHFLWNTPSYSSSSSSVAAAAAISINNGFCCCCKKKSMPLTRFCHAHILSDANQLLYKPCNYPTKSYPSGPTLRCMKPILKSAVPPLCSNHLHKAHKHFSRCLTNQGFTGTNKYPPKFNVIVSEFVRHIQSNRKHNTFSFS